LNALPQSKQRVVVICPGRGTYNKEELGYLGRLHGDKGHLLDVIDVNRRSNNQQTVSELDKMDKYSMRVHTAGENASSLIYACAQGDFIDIDTEKYDIVAVTGNSMGWYIALAAAQVLTPENAIQLINTMGSMMKNGSIGGQMIYPVMDNQWQLSSDMQENVREHIKQVNAIADCEVYNSIYLGGYLVIGGNEAGLAQLQNRLPTIDDTYPMRLFNHAAFHTPLLNSISQKARQILTESMFQQPSIPLIDGRGKIWQPHSSDRQHLYDYTLGHQVTHAYDFSAAIAVAIKEFAPDKLIVLGPGTTLGGAVGQCLVASQWQQINNKQAFINRQKSDPFVLAMGMTEQRKLVV
jgi:acyl transferase domain-containing protein